MMMRLYALMMIIMLTGCDTYYGLARRVNVDYVVNHQCVEDALKQVSEVREVEYKYVEGGISLTITGMKKPDQLHYYYYKAGDISGNICIQTNHEQKTEISQAYGALNVIPPQAHIDAIRPIMKKIEAAICSECGIDDIETLVSEWCNEVKCE